MSPKSYLAAISSLIPTTNGLQVISKMPAAPPTSTAEQNLRCTQGYVFDARTDFESASQSTIINVGI